MFIWARCVRKGCRYASKFCILAEGSYARTIFCRKWSRLPRFPQKCRWFICTNHPFSEKNSNLPVKSYPPELMMNCIFSKTFYMARSSNRLHCRTDFFFVKIVVVHLIYIFFRWSKKRENLRLASLLAMYQWLPRPIHHPSSHFLL